MLTDLYFWLQEAPSAIYKWAICVLFHRERDMVMSGLLVRKCRICGRRVETIIPPSAGL